MSGWHVRDVLLAWLALAALPAAALGQRAPAAAPTALVANVYVSNESFITRRVELRVNGVVVLDKVVGPALNTTGVVHSDSLKVAPGTHTLVLIDHHRGQQHRLTLTVRSGPICIYISLMGPATGFRAGNYVCGLA